METPELASATQSWTRVERPKDFESVFVRYKLRMTFLTKLCGGVPNKKELIQPWLEARAPKVRPPGGKSIDEVQEEDGNFHAPVFSIEGDGIGYFGSAIPDTVYLEVTR